MRTPAQLLVRKISALIALPAMVLSLSAQTSKVKPASSADAGAPGFSIESEMLTYQSLESNSDAIACEVAGLLGGIPDISQHFKRHGSGTICAISLTNPNFRVVILPMDSQVPADFQIWRSDMEAMREILEHAQSVCDAAPSGQNPPSGGPATRGSTTKGNSGGWTIANLTPQTQMISAVLGLFASGYSVTPVGGTIQDQAFIDNLSRDLRIANVPVVLPATYMPNALSPLTAAASPFLQQLDQVLRLRDCLAAKSGGTTGSVNAGTIDEFLKSLSQPIGPPSNSGSAPSAVGNHAGPEPSSVSGKSRLISDILADGLAQNLGFSSVSSTAPAHLHLLLVKALESGGEVSRRTNVFGAKISYSGGSVVTYTLLSSDGQLECAGNAYDYAGPIAHKDFEKKLRAFAPDPSSQVILKRGQCPLLKGR